MWKSAYVGVYQLLNKNMNLCSHWTWNIGTCYEDDVTSALPTGNVDLVFAVDNRMYVKPDIWTENSEYKWISDEASYLPMASDFVRRAREFFFSALCSRHSSRCTAEHAGKPTDAWYPAVTARCEQDGALLIPHWLEHAFAKVGLGHDKRWDGHHRLRTSIHGNSSMYDRTLRS